MLAPFLWLFVCFAAGIFVSFSWHIFYFAVILVLVPGALSLCARSFRLALFAQGCFFFILGWSYAQLQVERYEQNSLQQEVASREQESLSIQAVVQEAPEISSDFFVLTVRVSTLAQKRVDGIARLTISGPLTTPLFAGDEIETYARFRLPNNFGSTGAFDYWLYLMKEGIHALGSVKSAALIHKTGKHFTLSAIPSRMRLSLIQTIRKSLPARDGETLRALWLDDRSALPKETERQLIDAGIFHVIAISGFHVAVLVALAFFGFRRFLPYKYALLIISAFLLFYFLLLEGRSSITRSFLTFLIFAFAYWREESVNWATVLSLSALAQLVINPLELFDSGFQLTYLSTAAIVFIAGPLMRKVRTPRKIYQYIVDFFITMLSIQFTLLPYQAFVFHKIPFGSLLANFIAIPLSSILIAIAPFALPLIGTMNLMRSVIHHVLDIFFGGTALFSGIWLKVVPTPSGWMLAAFYAALVVVLILRRKLIRIVCLLFCFFCITSILWLHAGPEKGALRVHVIDVGQGDSILLQYPDGTADLIDSGGFWNMEALDVGSAILLPYLSSLHITHLHRAFLTHAHADHMSGFFTLLRYIPCDEFYVTRLPLADAGFQMLVAALPMDLRAIHDGASFSEGEVRISVLAPADSANSLHVRNDDSLVMLVQFHGTRVLLTGDAEKPTEQQLTHMADIHADYLKVAHHGSKTSTTPDFLQRVKPKAAFISVGRMNWFGHPNPEVVNRLRASHVVIYRTDQLGTISLTIKDRSATIQAYAWN
jgi:competence protein ComEC